MSRTKDEIAMDLYRKRFSRLAPGQKANVTRVHNAESASCDWDCDCEEEPQPTTPSRRARTAPGFVVSFARTGVNGVKTVAVTPETTVEQALRQSGLSFNPDKEGVVSQSSGETILLNTLVQNGETYFLVVGVDSSN